MEHIQFLIHGDYSQAATWPSGYGAGFRPLFLIDLTCSKERGFESLSCQLPNFILLAVNLNGNFCYTVMFDRGFA